MPIATLKDVLEPAAAGGYSIAGLVVLGWEDVLGFIAAAEETGIPIILQAGPGCRKYTPIPVLGAMLRYAAERASVPVVMHIDHAYTLEECRQGIEHGFSSVMIDGSALPLDDNIALTAEVTALAHKAGVSTEGEIGFVGYIEGLPSRFTDPEEAHRFERESGIDALAISVGNVHLSTEKTAGIDLAALAAVEARTQKPLVLHGGSGIPLAMRRHIAANTRVAKFNVGTELRMAFGAALRAELARSSDRFDRLELLAPTVDAVDAASREVINALRYPTA